MSSYSDLARAVRRAYKKAPKCPKPMVRATPPPIPQGLEITQFDIDEAVRERERRKAEAAKAARVIQ